MNEKIYFNLTKEHLLLLRNSYVFWCNAEFGAAGIDPKRPYGNSDVLNDIAKILNIEHTVETEYHLNGVHEATKYALQIVLSTGKFKEGFYYRYKNDYCGMNWKIVKRNKNKNKIPLNDIEKRLAAIK